MRNLIKLLIAPKHNQKVLTIWETQNSENRIRRRSREKLMQKMLNTCFSSNNMKQQRQERLH